MSSKSLQLWKLSGEFTINSFESCTCSWCCKRGSLADYIDNIFCRHWLCWPLSDLIPVTSGCLFDVTSRFRWTPSKLDALFTRLITASNFIIFFLILRNRASCQTDLCRRVYRPRIFSAFILRMTNYKYGFFTIDFAVRLHRSRRVKSDSCKHKADGIHNESRGRIRKTHKTHAILHRQMFFNPAIGREIKQPRRLPSSVMNFWTRTRSEIADDRSGLAFNTVTRCR